MAGPGHGVRVSAQLVALCIDANDPTGLARFWAAALRWEVGEASEDSADLVPTDDTPFPIIFHRVAAPKARKNLIHLDLTTTSTDDQAESVRRLLDVGARHVDVGQTPEDRHVVLADPEGNEFCLIEPENSFLAGCGRLGSITCDGTPAVGYFWAAALGWPLVWDQDEETAIRAPDGTGPFITWGPPVPPKAGKNRFHLHLAPPADGDRRTEVERLTALGASRVDIGQGAVEWEVMADPDGNEFCVLPGP